MQIRQYLYFSLASRNHKESDLLHLLEHSRERNVTHQVTGLLIYVGNYFIQHIEGPPSSIEQLVVNIKNDDRISDFTKLIDDIKTERAFPDWLMGFRTNSSETRTEGDGFFDLSLLEDLKFLNAKDNAALQIMKGFYAVNRGAPTFRNEN